MSGGTKVREFWFADEDPEGKPLDEYALMFGPSMDGGGLELHQCAEEGWIDEDAALLVLERGDAVSVADGAFHQTVRCMLVHEAWLEDADAEALEGREVADVPEELTGVNLPEVEPPTDDGLAPLRLSINMARSAGGADDGADGESVWRRLGKKAGRLF
jgi:hypothetical protein